MKINEHLKLLSSISHLSSRIGRDLNLIQGAGGNTSVKNDDILSVKASGYWLRDAEKKNIFVPVCLSGVLDRLQKGEKDPVGPEVVSIDGENANFKPSIETTLHALMPHKYVMHTHSVNVIAKAVLKDGRECLKHMLKGLSWKWIPYARPGIPLTSNIQNALKSRVDILILANHGVVIGADSIDELIVLHNHLEGRLEVAPRVATIENSITTGLDSKLENIDGYQWSSESLIKQLAFDKDALIAASSGILYPDHIVFLGPENVLVIDSIKNIAMQREERKVIIVRNYGVLLANNLSEGALAMVHCLASVLLRIEPQASLRYLSDSEKIDISDWDAEKYRQQIQK